MRAARSSRLAAGASLSLEKAQRPTGALAPVNPPRRPRNEGIHLGWPGRTWQRGERGPSGAHSGAGTDSSRLVCVEASPARSADVRLVQADALVLAEGLAAEGLAGAVDLVYVDPPFASERDYVSEARLDGPSDGRVLRTRAYEDRWSQKDGGIGAYLEMLAPRLDALAGLLSPRGTLWVHLDWRAAYLVRVVLDEIFGRDGFVNEIVWRRAPNLGRQATSGQFGRTLDTLLVYGGPGAVIVPPTRLEPIAASAIRWDDEGRPFTTAPRGDYTDASIAKLEAAGRVHRTSSGRVYIKYFLVQDDEGAWCRERRIDTLWTDVSPLRHAPPAERTGYPTQKPRSLLDRIVLAATPPGGLVVDAFAGSGSTGASAHALGRRVILGDASPVAIATSRARLLRQGADVRVDRSVDASEAAVDAAPVVAVAEAGVVRDREVTVHLRAPKEPLAWAVGREQAGVFVRAWHAERAPGKRSVPAPLQARIAPDLSAGTLAASSEAPLLARVWTDDGRVGTAEVSR